MKITIYSNKEPNLIRIVLQPANKVLLFELNWALLHTATHGTLVQVNLQEYSDMKQLDT